jgi:hypothetical protein
VKAGFGHVFAALVLIRCGPVHHGLPAAEDASAPGLKSDPPSNPNANTRGGSTRGGASISAGAAEASVPEVVPGSPIASGKAEADPRLVVQNAYLKRQYVFLGSRLLGSVEAGAQGSFEIPPGAHSVTFSDSRDGRSNRKTLAEVYDSGYAYRYDVLAH